MSTFGVVSELIDRNKCNICIGLLRFVSVIFLRGRLLSKDKSLAGHASTDKGQRYTPC